MMSIIHIIAALSASKHRDYWEAIHDLSAIQALCREHPEMNYNKEKAEFIKELDSRPMSTWTDDEGARYADLTGQVWGMGNSAEPALGPMPKEVKAK